MKFRSFILIQLFWLGLVVALGAWWGSIILNQAHLIEGLGGYGQNYLKTRNMLFWESAAFIFLAALLSLTLILFYWRDFKRSKSLQVFFAGFTHEIRTPLASIRLQAEAISDRLPSEEKVKNLVSRLLEDTSRLDSQVEKILELARMEGGGPLYCREINLNALLKKQMDYWSAHFGDRLQFESHFFSAPTAVLADSAALELIFKNIIENSVRHSSKKPVIVRVEVEQINNRALLRLVDNGEKVLPENRQPNKFGTLFQKAPLSQGSGIGLFLIKSLMQRMKGAASFGYLPEGGFQVELIFSGDVQNGTP